MTFLNFNKRSKGGLDFSVDHVTDIILNTPKHFSVYSPFIMLLSSEINYTFFSTDLESFSGHIT